MVYSNTVIAVYGGKWAWYKSGHLSFFTFFEALDTFEVQFHCLPKLYIGFKGGDEIYLHKMENT